MPIATSRRPYRYSRINEEINRISPHNIIDIHNTDLNANVQAHNSGTYRNLGNRGAPTAVVPPHAWELRNIPIPAPRPTLFRLRDAPPLRAKRRTDTESLEDDQDPAVNQYLFVMLLAISDIAVMIIWLTVVNAKQGNDSLF